MNFSIKDLGNKLSDKFKSTFILNTKETLSFLKTGLVSLDIFSEKGIPSKHLTEIYGMSGSGKSSLVLQIIATAQRQGHNVLYIDSEHAFDFTYAKKLGINEDRLIVMFPSSADQIMEFVPSLLEEAKVSLIVIDTVCGVIPQAELSKDFTESYKSLQGMFWKQAIPKLLMLARIHDSAIIALNQVRDHIGTTKKVPTNIGSIASKAILRYKTESVGSIVNNGVSIGERILISISKNLLGKSNQAVEIDLYYDTGFSVEGSLLEAAINKNIVQRKGTWFHFKDTILGQGKAACIEKLNKDEEISEQLLNAVYENIEKNSN